jgi:hypothetical protein
LKGLLKSSAVLDLPKEWTVLLEQVLPMSVSKFYDIVFSDDQSKVIFSMDEFAKRQGKWDISIE